MSTVQREVEVCMYCDGEGVVDYDGNPIRASVCPECVGREHETFPALVAACRSVVQNWERGDLAKAVRACAAVLALVEAKDDELPPPETGRAAASTTVRETRLE